MKLPPPPLKKPIEYIRSKVPGAKTLEQAKGERNWTKFCESCGTILPKFGPKKLDRTPDGWICVDCVWDSMTKKAKGNEMKTRDDREDVEVDDDDDEFAAFYNS